MPGAWEIGRILDDQGNSHSYNFPTGVTKHLKASGVFVRWARQISTRPRFWLIKSTKSALLRWESALIRSQMTSGPHRWHVRVANLRIELEAHQIEVVRRVLQDPVQRYLLADEVGLGKTIEAGILIRQRVLDAIEDFAILCSFPSL